ncbi:MAG: DMT family transporter, partial [Candidatus Nanohaloarchaea archaeon]|nr:DMT family transporter [Candidatus Nanohaloarchaea archaeon]
MFPWYVFAVATAVLAAFASIVEKNTLNFGDESPLQYSTMFAVLNAVFSLFLLPFVDLAAPPQAYVATYASAVLGSTLGFLLVAHAMKHADISQVSPLLNVNPVFVAVLATLFLGERLSLLQ